MPSLRSIADRLVRSILEEEDEAADFAKDFAQSSPAALGPIPTEHEPHILRAVRMQDWLDHTFYLILWSTEARTDGNQLLLGYRLVGPGGVVIYQGTGFKPARQADTMDDDDYVLRILIDMLTDDPEETGSEVSEYTQSQLDFIKRSGEALKSDYGMEMGQQMPFQDLPGYEHQEE